MICKCSHFPAKLYICIQCPLQFRHMHAIFRGLNLPHHKVSPSPSTILYRGHWGTTDDLTTSFLHLFLFSATLWYLVYSKPVHSLMLSSRPAHSLMLSSQPVHSLMLSSRPAHSLMLSSHTSSCVCVVFFPLSLYLARWFRPDLNGKHVHITAVCISL